MSSSLYMYESRLWKTSLGEENKWNNKELSIKLISALDTFRKNAEILANEISNDLPDFTVHDISHIDSLWEIASTISGEDYILNPVEAFVFGGAVLLHDLGMAAVAYSEGISNLKEGIEWNDILEVILRRKLGRVPTDNERKNPNTDIVKKALEQRLRMLHAVHAERLPEIEWKTKDGKTYRLLEDSILLDHLGETIGRVAASHWWAINKVSTELSIVLGAPPTYPASWNVDVLKLSCLIRVADAAHIDNRRADGFRRALHRRSEYSENHWIFQNHLARPTIENDQLVYNSIKKFSESEIDAWWVGYDTLKMVDCELHDVDVLLKETGKIPFKVSSVKNVESPTRLSKQLLVYGWEPLGANLHISDIPRLVKNLGGEALYGKSPYVPLRELIQNACDAIEAKRKMLNYGNEFGRITVKLGKDTNGMHWIEVEDNGIGMSERVLAGRFLDFGSTFWGSDEMIEEHKGLISSGYEPIGKFGIGFFSVFMWSDHITVTSRSMHKGPDETCVLIFGHGLSKRAILKKCDHGMGLVESGTRIRVYINDLSIIDQMITRLKHYDETPPQKMDEKLAYICRRISPCLDADLILKMYEEKEIKILKADDWKTIDSSVLLKRIAGYGDNSPSSLTEKAEELSSIVQPIYDENDNLIARACILNDSFLIRKSSLITGVITCGGLYMSTINNVAGIFCGKVSSASRNSGKPIAIGRSLSNWATKQGQIIKTKYPSSNGLLCEVADIVYRLGGKVDELPICEINNGWLSYTQIKSLEWSEKIGLTDYYTKSWLRIQELFPDILYTKTSYAGFTSSTTWPNKNENGYFYDTTLMGLVAKALFESWGLPFNKYKRKVLNSEAMELWDVGRTPEGAIIKENVYVISKPK